MRLDAVLFSSAFVLIAALTPTPQAFADTVLTPTAVGIDLVGYSSSAEYSTLSSSPQTYALTDSVSTLTGGNTGGLAPEVHGGISVGSVPPLNHTDFYNLGQGFDSESYIFYEFAVNGPENQQVSVNISSSGSATVSGLYPSVGLNATAYLDIIGNGSTLVTATACAGAPSLESDPCDATSGPLSNAFTVNQTATVLTNTAYLVNIYASNSMVAPDQGISGSFSAYSSVDPTITLSTSDPAYTLQFSPGLLGSPAIAPTPEPSSLLLAATGLAAAAGALRRRTPAA